MSIHTRVTTNFGADNHFYLLWGIHIQWFDSVRLANGVITYTLLLVDATNNSAKLEPILCVSTQLGQYKSLILMSNSQGITESCMRMVWWEFNSGGPLKSIWRSLCIAVMPSTRSRIPPSRNVRLDSTHSDSEAICSHRS